MSIITRGKRSYIYGHIKGPGNKVANVYLGRVDCAADRERYEDYRWEYVLGPAEDRERRRQRDRRTLLRWQRRDAEFGELGQWVEAILMSAGLRRHARGELRKPDTPPAPAPAPPGYVSRLGAHRVALVMAGANHPDRAARIRQDIERTSRELAGSNPTPLETVLAGYVATTRALAEHMDGHADIALAGGMTGPPMREYDRYRHRAHMRFTKACATLAKVRKLERHHGPLVAVVVNSSPPAGPEPTVVEVEAEG